MSPLTAVCFVLLSASLVFQMQTRESLAALLSSIVWVCAVANLLAYGYGVNAVMGMAPVPMAFSTTGLFIFLSTGMIASLSPEVRPLRWFSGSSTRSKLFREIVPGVFLLLVIQDALVSSFVIGVNTHVVAISALGNIVLVLVAVSLLALRARALGREIDRTSEALRKSEAQFRDLFENSPDAVFVEDEHGIVLDVNKAACKLHGLKREQLIGRSVLDLVPQERREQVAREFPEWFSGELAFREGLICSSDGQEIPIELHGSMIQYRGKKAVLIHARNVSERRRLEAQLRHAQKIKAIGQLAGGVAHDFNNLLAAMMIQLSLLQRKPNLPPDVAKLHQDLMSEAEQAATLTRQLLMFGRQSILNIKPVELNELVTRFIGMARRLLGEPVEVVFQPGEHLPTAELDSNLFEQVLLNLALNARDAMPQGGRITIKTQAVHIEEKQTSSNPDMRAGQFICLSVSDTGCGINDTTLKHIFEPFFTTKDVGKGTGLGLSTVYGIVAQHKGWVEVQSKVGSGSTFYLYIPASTQRAAAKPAPVMSNSVLSGSETILLVEDELVVNATLTRALQQIGYRVFSAANGAEALKIWRQHNAEIQLLLTDMVMPGGISGLDLAQRLRQERSDLKIIISTGYSPDALLSVTPGQDIQLLPKPYTTPILAKAIRDCLEKNSSATRVAV